MLINLDIVFGPHFNSSLVILLVKTNEDVVHLSDQPPYYLWSDSRRLEVKK